MQVAGVGFGEGDRWHKWRVEVAGTSSGGDVMMSGSPRCTSRTSLDLPRLGNTTLGTSWDLPRLLGNALSLGRFA
jgi:hypothetical protein